MSKRFPDALLQSILTNIDQHLDTHEGPHYAAFDADGTLWDSDVGETFFQHQIDSGRLEALKAVADPWAHYHALKKEHPPKAYLWLAQVSEGHNYEDILQSAVTAAKNNPPKVFEEQLHLISELQTRGISVFIVSASVEWAVLGAIAALNLSKIKAIGVKTKILNGTVTKEQDGPVTWQPGKPQALLEQTGEKAPIFCSGNTNGDIHLLKISKTVPLCIQTQNQPNRLFDEEQKLLNIALKEKWLRHSFA